MSPEWERTHPELVQRYYMKSGKAQVDSWNILPINQVSPERMGYPTQKPLTLYERVIKASSGMSRALLKFNGGSVHDYATIADDSPRPSRASRARRAATSAGIS